jgi:hypothetical protein
MPAEGCNGFIDVLAQEDLSLGGRVSKYHSKRSGAYASKREANRAGELLLLQKIGEISDLEEQVKYELIPKQDGERAVTYTADFRYRQDGELIVEDSKGMKTQQYIIRRKLMLFMHKIKVRET